MNNHLAEINVEVYAKLGFTISNYSPEAESKAYDASKFLLNDLKIIDRNAKVTPKKVGQFVTFWKRDPGTPITPFDDNDAFDFFTVSCREGEKLGQFVFPKAVLVKKGIISTVKKEGKRAFRVYPSWDMPKSKQAIQTQNWQQDFFYLVAAQTDLERVTKLYRQK